jgi:hypothetical protein
MMHTAWLRLLTSFILVAPVARWAKKEKNTTCRELSSCLNYKRIIIASGDRDTEQDGQASLASLGSIAKRR